jgi:hypothetical protein
VARELGPPRLDLHSRPSATQRPVLEPTAPARVPPTPSDGLTASAFACVGVRGG